MSLNYKKVEKVKSHIDLLYDLLEKREFNISHNFLPDYKSHKEFVENYIYRVWKLVYEGENLIGTYYITYENFLGINLISSDYLDYEEVIKYVLKNETPLEEIKSTRNKNFLINVNPDNLIFKKALNKLNFKLIQNTYLCSN